MMTSKDGWRFRWRSASQLYVELDPNLILHLHCAAGDLDRLDAELGLPQPRGADVVPLLLTHLQRHRARLTVQRQVALDPPTARPRRLDRRRTEHDLRMALAVEHLRAEHRCLDLGTVLF